MSNESREKVIGDLFYEFRAGGTATDTMDDAVARLMGLNRTDLRCLDILEREGPITAGRLAELARLSPGAVTAVLDRVEKAGYARRRNDPEDRRRVLVEVTPKMREGAARAYGPLAEWSTKQLENYTTDELVLIRDFLRSGREQQEAQTLRILNGEI
jgi:DNA-binding MarR family transcriptional regulator